MPVRLITATPLVEELLVMVSWPVAAPETVGSNTTLKVTLCVGFRVNGAVAPETEKPVPEIAIALMVKGCVPFEVSVTVCVEGVFRLTFPKGILVALMFIVARAAFNCRERVLEVVPAIADSVTVCAVLTAETVAVNVEVVEPDRTVTDDGTVTAALLLEMPTVKPPLAAAAFTVTEQESVPAPVMDKLVHESAVSTGTPVPLREIAVEVPVDESLTSVNCPVAAPATEGSNCTVRDVL